MKVKICGITNIDDALLCINEGADALGLIFAPESPRCIDLHKAGRIVSMIPRHIIKIGVFVNKEASAVNEISNDVGLDAVQLHGDESSAYTGQINKPVIKAFRVNDIFDFSILESYKECSFLLDSYSAHSNGGSGIPFNWEIIPKDIRQKIILAGGISQYNLEAIYKNIRPAAIDLSSSLESSPGIKDYKKVKDFFKVLRKIKDE